MQMMDNYHVPHGVGSGFESGAWLSIPSVRLSSSDGVLGDDTFFRHTLLGVGCASTITSCDARNFLRWIRRLAFFWLWSLICFASSWSRSSSWIRRFSTNATRASMFGSEGFYLSRVSSSDGPLWLGCIVQPSVWRRISPPGHWCWAGFLRPWHQCGRLLYSRTACPGWAASRRRLPCRERQSRRE